MLDLPTNAFKFSKRFKKTSCVNLNPKVVKPEIFERGELESRSQNNKWVPSGPPKHPQEQQMDVKVAEEGTHRGRNGSSWVREDI